MRAAIGLTSGFGASFFFFLLFFVGFF